MEITQDIKGLCERTVGDVVAEDYRRARVFERYGIDFCCGGNKTVKDACDAKGVPCDEIMNALASAEQKPAHSHYLVDARPWPADFLANYIVRVHHQYIRENSGPLRQLTRTVARVHGDTNPESMEIADLVDEVVAELDEHMDAEEKILFPYIERLCSAKKIGLPMADVRFESVNEPIQMMEAEHDHAGEIMHRIRKLSDGYTLPATACNTYRAAYERLQEFEADLHRHVHLENNILFPATSRLEEEVAAAHSA